jgi:hypothetical protein
MITEVGVAALVVYLLVKRWKTEKMRNATSTRRARVFDTQQEPLTVFYAGNGASIEQACKYVGGAAIHGISCASAPLLLHNVLDQLPYFDPCDAKRSVRDVPWFMFWSPALQLLKHAFLGHSFKLRKASSPFVLRMSLIHEAESIVHQSTDFELCTGWRRCMPS